MSSSLCVVWRGFRTPYGPPLKFKSVRVRNGPLVPRPKGPSIGLCPTKRTRRARGCDSAPRITMLSGPNLLPGCRWNFPAARVDRSPFGPRRLPLSWPGVPLAVPRGARQGSRRLRGSKRKLRLWCAKLLMVEMDLCAFFRCGE